MLDEMNALSSAEDLFTFLLLPYDPAVLDRARLHVMKRMGEYLARIDMDGLDDDAVFLEARKALKTAHADFVASTPRAEKTLKVYARKPANMVQISPVQFAPQ
ncbi:nitrogen fixation protein NifW [Rhodovulum strictum]|uniref:Nitrogenase-stabilizing/protective protein NifW n=1 Tax=Rhodovulum strictum TaxID=58314 RepID=A0A844B6G2_9RHOB|nr:nitrogen fixation protein NifW [Rhodovulum strictum]